MSYRIKDPESLDAEVRRTGLEQIDRALAALSDSSLDEASRIHEVRKRCNKVRALLRLVRPELGKQSYRRLNRHFRGAARHLSDSRDAAVFKAREETIAGGARLRRLNEDLERGSALIESIEPRGAADGFEGLRAGFVKVHDRARADGAAAAASRRTTSGTSV